MRFLLAIFFLLHFSYGYAQQFRSVPASESGVQFSNLLKESPADNIITYEYFYNGAGVGIGDFNNDGLVDIYFTANMSENKLFLNKGGMKFEDITRQAGVQGENGWKTGVSIADVNGDGWLDIYVCYSGNVDRENRHNQLFINNGNLTFTDKAREMGLDDAGYSTQAVFFDYDRDNDLDCFLLNHNTKNLRNFDAAFVKKMIDEDAGDHLFRNDNNKFTDVTQQAGIIANPLGYGLSAVASDVNNDGWPDLYVTNDYVEEDYLYINNGDGTFTDKLKEQIGHISNFSMGCDIADINNDGYTDIFTLDMLPEDNKRQKLLYTPDNYELYNNQLSNGFYHQLMRNMLQVNNGNNTFSETGQLSGISNTDWSWASVFADFNNDGLKDLFITNGYGRDMTNRDFVKFYANERLKFLQGKTDERMFSMLRGIKTTALGNYMFENKGNLAFQNCTKDWGFREEGLSQGAAFADLDNDGDLDLIISRINQEAAIYRNQAVESGKPGRFLAIALRMPGKNVFAVGARLEVYCKGEIVVYEQFPVRGFQSSMLTPLHIGLPVAADSIRVRWPDHQWQTIQSPQQNTTLNISYQPNDISPQKQPTSYFSPSDIAFMFRHREDDVNDFKIQPLMPTMLSYNGPRMAPADVDGDGLEDIFVCGARNQTGRLMLQTKAGDFVPSSDSFKEDLQAEDTDAVFFDADGDGDPDLYIVSGAYASSRTEPTLQDRLYINEKGKFVLRSNALPQETFSGSCVRVADMDGDGDLDLFVGSRVIPGRYPETPESMILQNDGKGFFTNVTARFAPLLQFAGMITDAAWEDLNRDGRPDLIVLGEWMPVRIFINHGDRLVDESTNYLPGNLSGWWNTITAADIDKDGDIDFVVGNWGTNSQLKASVQEPATLVYDDFDKNGSVDPLLCYYIGGVSYPMASRDELTDQITGFRQRFPTYDAYSEATLQDFLTPEQLNAAKTLKADCFSSIWLENANGKLVVHQLPVQANMAPVYAAAVDDFTGDGHPDILMAGNIEQARIKIGKIDASYGVLLAGDGKGGFQYVDQLRSGLKVKGCVRSLKLIKNNRGKLIIFGINNELMSVHKYK